MRRYTGRSVKLSKLLTAVVWLWKKLGRKGRIRSDSDASCLRDCTVLVLCKTKTEECSEKVDSVSKLWRLKYLWVIWGNGAWGQLALWDQCSVS